MQNRKLQKEIEDIEYVRSCCAVLDANVECQAHWTRYLCVMVAGFLENSYHALWRDYLDNTDRRAVHLRRVLNPKASAFVKRAMDYNQTWTNELQVYMSPERETAIDSIMNQRHLIAHGDASSITMSQIAEYLPRCIAVVEFIEEKLLAQTLAQP